MTRSAVPGTIRVIQLITGTIIFARGIWRDQATAGIIFRRAGAAMNICPQVNAYKTGVDGGLAVGVRFPFLIGSMARRTAF